MVFICASLNLHITLMIQAIHIWFWEKILKFPHCNLCSKLDPHALDRILMGQLICTRMILHLLKKLHVKYLSNSLESCFTIAACAIAGPHRPWGLHWSYLEYTYQNHTCTYIADSLENHLLSFTTMQTMLNFGLHGTFIWTNLNLHILMMLHIKYCNIAIASSLGENI